MATNISKKKPLVGNRRSKSCRATKHAQKPNIQKKTIDGKKVRISASEARTLSK